LRISYWISDVCSSDLGGAFNFRGSDQQKKVGQLSGGERNRVHLAKMLKESANVLLLDEPTNDLDVDTLRSLEEAVTEFAGCVLVISHDRWFLDRIATHILARSEEHTSELQSLMRISYAVFCLKKKRQIIMSKAARDNMSKHNTTN